MTPAERDTYERDGYILRKSVFSGDEVATLRNAIEEVAAAVKSHATRDGAGPEAKMADGHRIQFSSRSAIQWEWREGSQEIRLIEPCAHLHPAFDGLFADERLCAPMRDATRADEIGRFTSKLNLKRAEEGSEFPFHQDYPYWYVAVGQDAADIATAMIMLDDADASNGALRVVQGSHAGGPASRDPSDPTRFLADASKLDLSNEVMLEVPAGSVTWFGSFLVHRSSPNHSGRDRRALLLSFQPAGRPTLHEVPYQRERVEELP